jgi:hypothetical protein
MSRAYDNAADARFPSGRRNLILNGNFDVWQRGTSGTSGYVSDRWTTGNVNGTTTAISQQSFTVGQTDVPGEPKYYHRTVVTSASASNSLSIFEQRVEDVRTGAGQLVTISFYAKADSNKNMSLEMLQDFGSGGSSDVNSLGVQKFSLTSSWQKFTKTVTLPSISGKTVGTSSYLACNFWMDAGSSFNSRTDSLGNQSGTFDIAQMQLELGNVATPFEHRSYGEELLNCARYYYKFNGGGGSNFSRLAMGFLRSSTNFRGLFQFPTEMRTTPTLDNDASVYHIEDSAGNADLNATVSSISQGGPMLCLVNFSNNSMGDNNPATVGVSNTADPVVGLGFDAEL